MGPLTRAGRRVVAAVVAGATLLAACGGSSGADRLPDLELPRLGGGESIALDTVEGPAVVNLWATWCAPCRRELPEFQEVHDARGGSVRFVGVNIGDRDGPALEFLDEIGVTFENYADFEGRLSEELRTATLPVTVVTGPDGLISVIHSGPMDAAELEAEIDRATGATAP